MNLCAHLVRCAWRRVANEGLLFRGGGSRSGCRREAVAKSRRRAQWDREAPPAASQRISYSLARARLTICPYRRPTSERFRGSRLVCHGQEISATRVTVSGWPHTSAIPSRRRSALRRCHTGSPSLSLRRSFYCADTGESQAWRQSSGSRWARSLATPTDVGRSCFISFTTNKRGADGAYRIAPFRCSRGGAPRRYRSCPDWIMGCMACSWCRRDLRLPLAGRNAARTC
jgi:hypothetical protein